MQDVDMHDVMKSVEKLPKDAIGAIKIGHMTAPSGTRLTGKLAEGLSSDMQMALQRLHLKLKGGR